MIKKNYLRVYLYICSIPQVLLHYGAMKYSKELMDDLLKGDLL